MACCDLLLVRCRRLQRSAKCKYTDYRSTYCLVIRDADVTVWDCGPWKSRVWALITGEPLNSRSRILAPKWREITEVDCIWVRAYWFSVTLFSKWLPGGHIRFFGFWMAWFRQLNSSLLWNYSFKFHVHVLCGCRQKPNDCQLCRFQNGCLVILNNATLSYGVGVS